MFSAIKKTLLICAIAASSWGTVVQPLVAHAQTVEENLEVVGEGSGLGNEDITIVIAKLIRTGLTFLGVIAVCIVLYGGFVWMTAGGDAQKVEQARKILINGGIGLVIILLSWSITSFIMNSLLGATGSSLGDSDSGSSSGGGGSVSGSGSSATFLLKKITPQGNQDVRNIKVQVVFSHTLSDEASAKYLTVKNSDTGDAIEGTVEVQGKRMTFVPSTACPEPHTTRFCFDENVNISIEVDEDLESDSGLALACSDAYPCSATFTTGSAIDTDDPKTEITDPDDKDAFSVDATESVAATAKDDVGIAVVDFLLDGVAFTSVVPESEKGEITVEGLWDTFGLLPSETYKLGAEAYDIAGNRAEDAITVLARASHCYNGVQDEEKGEAGVDCGGDKESIEYCGICSDGSDEDGEGGDADGSDSGSGSSGSGSGSDSAGGSEDGSSADGADVCEEDYDCAGEAACEAGVCVELPQIEGISPDNGIAGTFVTISGSGFGATAGKMYFVGSNGDDVEASVAVCSSGWSDEEIVVMVPDGAQDGRIKLVTASGEVEESNDAEGEVLPDFDVNEEKYPALCSIDPGTGAVADGVVLEGFGFGKSQEESTVMFGDTKEAASYTVWQDERVAVTVPSVSEAKYSVFVTVDGRESNPITFTVDNAPEGDAPSIVSVEPGSGGVGQYVTISGANFGETLGSVWFTSAATGEKTQASIAFPEACAVGDIWENSEITIIVPNIDEGIYEITVENADGQESLPVDFSVSSDRPTPGICALTPEAGDVGDVVVIEGDGFGSGEGKVAFTGASVETIVDWTDERIEVTVPSGAQTGPLYIISEQGVASNTKLFAVGEGEVSGTSQSGAAYAWAFSSGQIPTEPEVVIACSEKTISAVPNEKFTEEACVNAQVYVEFTVAMNEATLNDALTVERCNKDAQGGIDETCSDRSPVEGIFITQEKSVTFSPAKDFDTSTTYLVTVTTDAMSVDGIALKKDVSWKFTTKNTPTACGVEEVRVSPGTAALNVRFETEEFSALPVVDCTVLDARDYAWDWTVGQSVAGFIKNEDCPGGDAECATVEALAEGKTQVTATEEASVVSGSADLTVNFTDPYVTQYYPNCTEACANATVAATFNIPVNEKTLSPGTALFACANELCTSLTEVSGVTVGCVYNEASECTGVQFSFAQNLTTGKFYRAVISGKVKSMSGVPLIRTNYGGDFSWTFRVREDASVCAVDRVTVSPSSATSSEIGEVKMFSALAYGEADSCSVSGQLLDAFAYNWSWTNPIADENNDEDETTQVAAWTGSFADTDPLSVAEGCTATCTSAGSTPYAALCGDGDIEPSEGEECEDGNVASGDGCSSSCLREGNNFYGTCGNGTVERLDTGVGEDCDDGNVVDGDGCSAACLAEGASVIGATCGNRDVAVVGASLAGEECDDGNGRNNDGCSSECLFEGTPTFVAVGGALCGNGAIENPYESCDDGNTTSGDGCSQSCLLEGSSARYTTPSYCGDGTLGVGEECERGDAVGGDGCSEKCLLEGSSALFDIPSYCGDGVTGVGEKTSCEQGAGGDGNIDPVQSAAITQDAVFEISAETEKAIATVETVEPASLLKANAQWTLFCAATSDSECKNVYAQGVGTGNCCMDRPTVTLAPTGSDVCRNAAIYGTFSQEMDLGTFTETEVASGETRNLMFVKLDTSSSGGTCPDTHTVLDSGECTLPVTSYAQAAQNDGSYKVTMQTGVLLYPGGQYTLVVQGDSKVLDDEAQGVGSMYGVRMYGKTLGSFTASAEICAVDSVEVVDTTNAGGTFSSLDEAHDVVASAISFAAGSQEIAPIPGVYDWIWSGWKSDNKTIAEVDAASGSEKATVTPGGKNGTANIIATLDIQNNVVAIPTDEHISGSLLVTMLLCENPWPAIDAYPWIDDSEHEDLGAEEGSGWMRFGAGYCQDAGEDGTTEDLPDVSAVYVSDTQDDAIVKEYLFEVQGTNDVIGVRIASNGSYESPRAWYEAQGFSGSPSDTTVDGYAAVSDGRTTYIAAPNLHGSGDLLYPNIYIISYNENASAKTIAIYEQFLENFTLATNVDSVAYCTDGSAYSGTACVSDSDCATGEWCGDTKAKVQRDMKRLTDMTDLRDVILSYTKDNDGVPTLAAGTFVRALASSVWGSWSEILGGALEDDGIPGDPLNMYVGCGSDPFSAYDKETCVDETAGTYICPEKSHTYHYRAFGSEIAYISADVEYAAPAWFSPIDVNGATDGVVITIGNSASSAKGFAQAAFCDGVTVYGGENGVCGDGVLGANEVCEIGEAGGSAVACDGDRDGVDDGTISQVCNATCSAFIDDKDAECVAYDCGNGVVENNEVCDDGSANGKYGFCGSNCRYDTATYCGDGVLSGGELCDCGDAGVFSAPPSSGRAYGASAVGSCTELNGVYNASPTASCAWDCSAPAAYCGNGSVEGSETCDGADDTWAGSLCYQGQNAGEPCSSDAECGGGICGREFGIYAACDTGFTRVRTCDDDAGATCTYQENWTSISCTEIGSCGDGVVDEGEACDDGNTDSTDACTATCEANVCGDGYVYSDEEECDDGVLNGQGCDASYGSMCSSCTTSCRQTVVSGAYCGDGEVNGSEFCDGSDIPYYYFDDDTESVYLACSQEDARTEKTVVYNNATYTCRRVGLCDGGDRNGEYCTPSGASANDRAYCNSQSGFEASCVLPSCNASCASACPLTEASTSVLLTSNLPGAGASSSVDLYTFDESSTAMLPNAATLTMPACTVASALTGTVNLANMSAPTAYVVFVTDRSSSMGMSLGDSGSRMEVAQALLENAINEIFIGLGENAHISLVGYSNGGGTGMCADDNYSCSQNSDCNVDRSVVCEDRYPEDVFPNDYGFGSVTDESTLLSRIDAYTAAGMTETDVGLYAAKNLLDDTPSDASIRKVVVLLSDGQPDSDPSPEAQDIKDAGYELYTVALTTDPDLVQDMNDWSSNDGDETSDNGIDYAFDGETVTELQDAYATIVDSLLGVTISLISSYDGSTVLTSKIVNEGSSVSLPWPENFTCDPDAEQEIPVQLTFTGEGTVSLSNVRIDYCAP